MHEAVETDFSLDWFLQELRLACRWLNGCSTAVVKGIAVRRCRVQQRSMVLERGVRLYSPGLIDFLFLLVLPPQCPRWHLLRVVMQKWYIEYCISCIVVVLVVVVILIFVAIRALV